MRRLAERGPQPLPRHFQEAEAGDPPDLDPRAVHLHGVADHVLDGPLVLCLLHVDEVDDDQATEVAQAQLPGDLLGGLEVGVGRRRLDVRTAGGAGRVDVDRNQRLGVVNHEADARGQVHLVRIRRFDMALELEAREERHFVDIELELALRLDRHEPAHVLLAAAVGALVVAEDLADVVRQVVAQRPGDRVGFLVDQERRRPALGRGADRVPVGLQVRQVPLQLFGAAADAGRAHDRAHAVVDIQTFHGLARGFTVLALDPAGHAAGTRIVRHQHQEAPGQADVGGERRTLVAALFLFDLDDDFLALGQQFADVEPAVLGVDPVVLAGHFLEGQETVAVAAVIDEGRLEAGLDAGDPPFVDVGLLLFLGRNLDR